MHCRNCAVLGLYTFGVEACTRAAIFRPTTLAVPCSGYHLPKHAVNPSLGARMRHPCRIRFLQVIPTRPASLRSQQTSPRRGRLGSRFGLRCVQSRNEQGVSVHKEQDVNCLAASCSQQARHSPRPGDRWQSPSPKGWVHGVPASCVPKGSRKPKQRKPPWLHLGAAIQKLRCDKAAARLPSRSTWQQSAQTAPRHPR